MAVLHLFRVHEAFRGALALVTRRKLLHQIRGSLNRTSCYQRNDSRSIESNIQTKIAILLQRNAIVHPKSFRSIGNWRIEDTPCWTTAALISATAIVQLAVSEGAIEAVQKAVALIGNPRLTRAHPLERHLRDVLCARVHSPQSDSILKAAGVSAFERPTEFAAAD
jgi:hypothetical protein